MSVVTEKIFAPLPLVERGKAFVIGGSSEKKKILYPCLNAVIIRDVENPINCDLFEHPNKVTVAQYAPSGNYICSGDVTGKIKIWDAIGEEHRVKNEFRLITGPVRDIAWGPESKRLAVCGEGGDKFGAVILADSGNTVGNLNQIYKRANSITYKPTRPFRIATGDDGRILSIYEGPPFKGAHEHTYHTNFVNCVRYSPDGKYLASAGSDGMVFLFDAKTSEMVGQFGEKAHSGSVYGISWSPDSKELMTSSGDKTVKIWNVEAREEVMCFNMGNELSNQQQSCLWVADSLITASLGRITYLDRNNPETPIRILRGHMRPITKVFMITPNCHITGDFSGKMLKWNTESGEAKEFMGAGHTNKVAGLAYDPESDEIISAAWDDKVRYTCGTSCDFSASTIVNLESQPSSLVLAGGGYVLVNCIHAVVLLKDKKKVCEMCHNETFIPTCVAAHGNTVAIEKEGSGVKIFNIETDALVDSGVEIPSRQKACALSFSPDGSMLAVSFTNNVIKVFMVNDEYKLHKELLGHHLKPSILAWSPDSKQLASSGLDGTLKVWRIMGKGREDIKRAHLSAFINDIAWQTNETLLTVGSDCITKLWRVTW